MRLNPTSLGQVWAGIHTKAVDNTSSMSGKMRLNTRASGLEAAQAHLRPACRASMHGLQSLRKVLPRTATLTACRMAQASAPGMSVTNEGGEPCAAATVWLRLSNTTNDQPNLIVSGCESAILDPSV